MRLIEEANLLEHRVPILKFRLKKVSIFIVLRVSNKIISGERNQWQTNKNICLKLYAIFLLLNNFMLALTTQGSREGDIFS